MDDRQFEEFLQACGLFPDNTEVIDIDLLKQYRHVSGGGILYALALSGERVRFGLLAQYSPINDIPDVLSGQNGLMLALRQGWIQEAHILLPHADLYASDRDGNTLLHYASVSGDDRLIGKLLDCGLSPEMVNRLGISVFQTALEYDNNAAAGLFIERTSQTERLNIWLQQAVLAGRNQVVRLLSKRCDLNAPDLEGIPPLMRAMLHERTDTAELLIAEGASLLVEDGYGNTILHYAAALGNLLLYERVVTLYPELLNKKNRDGMTAPEMVVQR
jgi:ankyrin repeat protein